ncbi:MAG: sensor histidine kinase [Aestuariibacter sp.]
MAAEDSIARFFQQYGEQASQASDPCLKEALALLRDIAKEHESQANTSSIPKQFIKEIEAVCRGIGHNFNGVLANIRGITEITQMKAPNLPETAQQALETILSLSDRGEYSTQMIRYYGKAFNEQRQKLDLQVELPRMINDAKMTMEISFPLKQEATTPAMLSSNREMLEGCFAILIKNALQAIHYGAPGIPEITIQLAASTLLENGVCLSIQDNGEGMTEDTQARACDAFFTTRKAAEGVGLGLTIVKNFVTRQGGKLDITSTAGSGTTVSLHLPRI